MRALGARRLGRAVSCLREQLAAPAGADASIELTGWVRSKRVHRSAVFLDVCDGSTPEGVQVVLDGPDVRSVLTGCSVRVRGRLSQSPRGLVGALPAQRSQTEVQGSSVELLGGVTLDYPLPKKTHSLDALRETPLFRARSAVGSTVLRLRSVLSHEVHSFFDAEAFVQVHTPVLTANDCEGNNEVFRLQPQPNGKDFFSTPVFLTVSGQLEAELFCHSLKNVYTFGPTFRAENSNTRRHLSEFWMIEPEMAFANREDSMALGERLVQRLARRLLSDYGAELSLLSKATGQDLEARLRADSERAFAVVGYDEAIAILGRSREPFQASVRWEAGLAFEHENYLASTVFKGPVYVTDYPRSIKPFYMLENEDGRTVRCMDLLVPRVGELLGGSERESRFDVLFERMRSLKLLSEDYVLSRSAGGAPTQEAMGERLNWYLELRRQGSVPTSGWGIGFERLLLYLLGFDNVRDVIPLARTPGHCLF